MSLTKEKGTFKCSNCKQEFKIKNIVFDEEVCFCPFCGTARLGTFKCMDCGIITPKIRESQTRCYWCQKFYNETRKKEK